MSNTIAVLGLDAADYELAQKWECNNILLNNSQELSTSAYSLDVPATLEVWPTIATGLSPEEHGVILDASERSTEPVFKRAIIKGIQTFPDIVQEQALRAKEHFFESELPTADVDHIFKQGAVTNWPGITSCDQWQHGVDLFNQLIDNEIGESEFCRQEYGNAGKGIGWLATQSDINVPIAGVHIHILDSVGHIYGKRPKKLREWYKRVDSLVGWLEQRVDNLVIVSDHGMQSTVLNDPNPGKHSWRATISTTYGGDLPDSIADVRSWLDTRMELKVEGKERTDVDAPLDHLQDLGYLS